MFQVQAIEIEIDGGDYNGMPFVLLSDGKWMKNNGSDFYIDFGSETTKSWKVAPFCISLSIFLRFIKKAFM